MARGFRHRTLHELDLGLLAGILELTPGCLQLLACGAELPHKHGEIQQARNDEQQRPAEGENGDPILKIHANPDSGSSKDALFSLVGRLYARGAAMPGALMVDISSGNVLASENRFLRTAQTRKSARSLGWSNRGVGSSRRQTECWECDDAAINLTETLRRIRQE